MLKPRREADEALADAERSAVLRLEALMRRGGRMRDEALGVAEIVRDLGKLELVEHAERRLLAALDLEADQRRAAAHLLLHEGCLRMIGAAGIAQPRNLRMARQHVGDASRRLGL